MPTYYNIGYISLTGSAGYQKKLLEEGHTLTLWWPDAQEKPYDFTGLSKLYPGQVKVIAGQLDKHLEKINKCDFIISDHNDIDRLGWFEESIDHPYAWLPTPVSKLMEDSREFGKKIATYLDLDIPPSGKFFRHQADAIKFLKHKNKDKRVVIKATNNTIIPRNNQEAIDIIHNDSFNFFGTKTDWYIRQDGKKMYEKMPEEQRGVFFEDFVEGVECCFGGYFNGEEFLEPLCCPSEVKGSENKNRGSIITGEVGTITRFALWNELPLRVKNALKKLQPFLKNTGYKGYLDMNLIIDQDNDKYYFLEFTPRTGYPSSEMQVIAHMRLNGYGYGKFLARATGFENGGILPLFDKSKPWAVSNSFFPSGLGFANFDHLRDIKVTITGDDEIDQTKVDLCAFSPNFNAEGRMISHDWDRVCFVTAIGSNAADLNLIISAELDKLHGWGFTYRDDVGLDYVINYKLRTIFNRDEILPEKPGIREWKYKTYEGDALNDRQLQEYLICLEYWASREYNDTSFAPNDLRTKLKTGKYLVTTAEHEGIPYSFLLWHMRKNNVAYGYTFGTLPFAVGNGMTGIGISLLKYSHGELKKRGAKTITGIAYENVSILHKRLGYTTRPLASDPKQVIVMLKV